MATFSFTLHPPSVVDPEFFFSDPDPDPTLQLVLDLDPVLGSYVNVDFFI